MSYRGYHQLLCKQGHSFEMDCYWFEHSNKPVRCLYCDEKIIWWNLIDTTNGIGIPAVLKIKEFEISCKCSICKHTHIHRLRAYEIPIGIGHCVPEHTDIDSGHDAKREETK